MSIEGISLDQFSSTTQTEILSELESRTRCAMFHSSLYYDIKQDADTTDAHKRHITEL